uniref:Uncharacterized protein n=1 Tax=Anguilla anguilla TaxID=7936 RepID=A0A0E9QLY1_ANGAN
MQEPTAASEWHKLLPYVFCLIQKLLINSTRGCSLLHK